MRSFLSIICLVGFLAAPTLAADEPSNFALTIYSTADPATFDPQQLAQQRLMNLYNRYQLKLPGYGVIRETRKIELQKGENTIQFTDVASGIDPTTVSFQSLTAPDSTAVLEQNYEYDLVSSDKLLEKYLGQKIVLERRATGDAPAQNIEGTLLSYDGGNLVLQQPIPDGSRVQIVQRSGDIRLGTGQANLITKPTLVWKIDAEKPGKHDAQVTYQTDSLTWCADYNFVINKDDSAADIGAWVTVLNESGGSYPNAKLKLVAGDVQRVQPEQRTDYMMEMRAMKAKQMSDTGFAEKSFFEYHLYTLGRTTSLANNSTKQIELFPSKSNVPVTKTFVYYGLAPQCTWMSPNPNTDRNLGTESNKKVDIYLLLKNSEQNGLGIPLPAGRIRVYKQDEADAALEFIGEDVIQHTPKDEEVMVKLGSAFDVVGERKQTDFNVNVDQHWITESFEIKLRNHKKEAVKVIVKENLFRWANWEITKSSDKYEKQDYRTIHIPVEVKPDGEKVVTYSVRYTW